MVSKRIIVRKIAPSVGALLLVCTALFFCFRYELNHLSFNFPSDFPSKTELEPFVARIKAAAALVAVIKRPDTTVGANWATYGEQEMRANAKLFDAWQSAVELGNATLEHTEKGEWVRSSSAAEYISPTKRLDPWNHAFCLLRRDDILLTVSAGPTAKGSPVCENIRMASTELATLPTMKLIQSPAGNLILMLRAQPAQKTQ